MCLNAGDWEREGPYRSLLFTNPFEKWKSETDPFALCHMLSEHGEKPDSYELHAFPQCKHQLPFFSQSSSCRCVTNIGARVQTAHIWLIR